MVVTAIRPGDRAKIQALERKQHKIELEFENIPKKASEEESYRVEDGTSEEENDRHEKLREPLQEEDIDDENAKSDSNANNNTVTASGATCNRTT